MKIDREQTESVREDAEARKPKTPQEMIEVAKLHIEQGQSINSLAKKYGVSRGRVQNWVRKYKQGEKFDSKRISKTYTKELKQQAVLDYLNNKGSVDSIAEKYGILHLSTFRNWIRKYKQGQELKTTYGEAQKYPWRETTFEERVEIVDFAISQGRDIRLASNKYEIDYSQIYSWLKRFDKEGVEGLRDWTERKPNNRVFRKTTLEERIEIVNFVMEHGRDCQVAVKKYGVSYSQVIVWVRNFEKEGVEGLKFKWDKRPKKDKKFKKNEKNGITFEQRLEAINFAVEQILDLGSGSEGIRAASEKYGFSYSQIYSWIVRFKKQGREGLRDWHNRKPENRSARKTTFEERVEIVDYAMKHERGYQAAMGKYGVSRHQISLWVRKFKKEGIEGLKDGRGRPRK
jgi:transposase